MKKRSGFPEKNILFQQQRASALLMLIAVILVISVLGAAIVSMISTDTYQDMKTANTARSGYMAQAGKRYALLQDLPENTYVTLWEENGLFRITEGNSPSAQTIAGEGFRVFVTDCGIKSAGVVNEGTAHAAVQTLLEEHLSGMPCWDFNTYHPLIADWTEDSCGTNSGILKGSTWTRICEGISGGAIRFGGSDYMESKFRPFCEIGNASSFSISVWVRPKAQDPADPADTYPKTVLGLSDADNAFALRIDSSENWQWAYGNLSNSFHPAAFGQWQQITLIYDSLNGLIRTQVSSCSGTDPEDTYDYASAAGNGEMPRIVKYLWVGAENSSGSPAYYFKGEVDEIRIYDSVTVPPPTESACLYTGAATYYPFTGNAENEGLSAPLFDGTVKDAQPALNRFLCPGSAWFFDGASHIEGDMTEPSAPATPMIADYPFSLTAWFRPDSTDATEKVIFSFTDKDADNVQSGIYVNEFSQPCIRIKDSGGGTDECGSTALNAGTWYHIAGIFSDAQNRDLYIDGVSVMPSAPPVNAAFPAGQDRWSIGCWGSLTPSGYFKGAIDDISVWSETLSAQSISSMSQERPD
ncbi:MAG: LamG domain-containing protein [Desulfococcaceae bacterium]|jgi:hypothetical protein|nr:LamG domain-containing protein [Desulfococcaceae bacterium]